MHLTKCALKKGVTHQMTIFSAKIQITKNLMTKRVIVIAATCFNMKTKVPLDAIEAQRMIRNARI